MDLLTAIFDALMRQPVHKTDTESREERIARMHIVAESIDAATKRAACVDVSDPECKPVLSDRRLLAALLLGKGKGESGFAQYVHEGRCQDGPVGQRCDSDRFGVARAHGPWQQWRIAVYPQSDWQAMHAATPRATQLAAWHAATQLAGSLRQCLHEYPGDEIASAMAGYSGSCNLLPPGKVRSEARTVRGFLAVLPAK